MRHGQCTCTRSVSIWQLLRENINKIRFNDEKQTKISTTTTTTTTTAATTATHKCARKNKKIGDIAHSKYVAKNSYSKVTHSERPSERVREPGSQSHVHRSVRICRTFRVAYVIFLWQITIAAWFTMHSFGRWCVFFHRFSVCVCSWFAAFYLGNNVLVPIEYVPHCGTATVHANQIPHTMESNG